MLFYFVLLGSCLVDVGGGMFMLCEGDFILFLCGVVYIIYDFSVVDVFIWKFCNLYDGMLLFC